MATKDTYKPKGVNHKEDYEPKLKNMLETEVKKRGGGQPATVVPIRYAFFDITGDFEDTNIGKDQEKKCEDRFNDDNWVKRFMNVFLDEIGFQTNICNR
mmetsp:Transcript_30353/g.55468  ORF Transcript_30353/g.55468 Transcript_30353/m.55468 type:complete len:99 (+) Transcript_30353:2388-2684(+)